MEWFWWLLLVLVILVLLGFVGYRVRNPREAKTTVYRAGQRVGSFRL
jgi:hypothetical protein